jgi:23S rRNA pseudoU1915 N3-methylase RlmH
VLKLVLVPVTRHRYRFHVLFPSNNIARVVADEWQSKIERYTKFKHVNLKSNPKKTSSHEAQMKSEATKLLSTLRPRDFVVVLDERGFSSTSFDIANLLAQAGASQDNSS